MAGVSSISRSTSSVRVIWTPAPGAVENRCMMQKLISRDVKERGERRPRPARNGTPRTGIARITINNPERKNTYDPVMRSQMGEYLDQLAEGRCDQGGRPARRGRGVQAPAPTWAGITAWYGRRGHRSCARESPALAEPAPVVDGRPQVVRLLPRVSWAFRRSPWPRSAGYALGGGFELALMADISVTGRTAKVGMPATRFLGPLLGSSAHVLLPARALTSPAGCC